MQFDLLFRRKSKAFESIRIHCDQIILDDALQDGWPNRNQCFPQIANAQIPESYPDHFGWTTVYLQAVKEIGIPSNYSPSLGFGNLPKFTVRGSRAELRGMSHCTV